MLEPLLASRHLRHQALARQARETREERCDDAAVRACGSARDDAMALGVLAGRASGTWLTAAMGAQVPSLANLIRPILKGDTMTGINRVQAFGLHTAVVILFASGAMVGAGAIEGVRSLPRPDAGNSAGPGGQTPAAIGVPTGYHNHQTGSPISLIGVAGSGEHCFTRVHVRNISEQRVASIRFVAIVEHRDLITPVILVTTEPVPIALEPGVACEAAITLLPVRDVLEWKTSRGVRAQALLGLLGVVFADPRTWAITPPPDATTVREVFMEPKPFVWREQVVAAAPPGLSTAPCRDARGRTYSESAMLTIGGKADVVAKW